MYFVRAKIEEGILTEVNSVLSHGPETGFVAVLHIRIIGFVRIRDVPDVIFLLSGRNRNRNRIVRNMFLTNKIGPSRWSN